MIRERINIVGRVIGALWLLMMKQKQRISSVNIYPDRYKNQSVDLSYNTFVKSRHEVFVEYDWLLITCW